MCGGFVSFSLPVKCCLIFLAGAALLSTNPTLASPAAVRQFGHGSRHAVAFSPDGCSVLIAGTHAQLFDAETGTLLQQFLGHSGTVNSAIFTPDGQSIVTGSSDHTVRFWNLRGEEVALWPHPATVAGIAISPDGKRVLTMCLDLKSRLWDVASNTLLRETKKISFVSARFPAGAFSPDGTVVATAAEGGGIDLWNVNTYEEVGHIETGIDLLNALAFSPDGSTLMVALGDSATMAARLYDLRTKLPLWTATAHTNVISSVAFAPDGKWIATSSWDGTARIWEATSGRELCTMRQTTLESIAVSPDGRRLITSAGQIWDVENCQLAQSLGNQARTTVALAVSADGARILTGTFTGVAQLWETASGRLLHTFTGHTGAVQHVSFSPDGATLLTASPDGLVRWWNAVTWEEVRSIKVPAASSVAVSPDEKRIITSNGTVNWGYDLPSGEQVLKFTTLPGGVGAPLAFSPDGQQIAATSAGHAKVFSTQTGRELHALATAQTIASLAFSADGARLFNTGYARAEVWDLATETRIWMSGDANIRAAALAPHGKLALTARDDGTLLLWSTDSSKVLGITDKQPLWPVSFAAFSPDGHQAFVGNEDVLFMWDTAAFRTTVPLRVTHLQRLWGNVLLDFEGSAATAFQVTVQSTTALTPDAIWQEDGRATLRDNNRQLRVPDRGGPQRFYRAYLVPP